MEQYNKKHNQNWSRTLNHPYRKLKISGSGSGKTNATFSLLSHQPDIDDIYLYSKDRNEVKY